MGSEMCIRDRDRFDVLQNIYNGLNYGGAFIFAEKTVCDDSRLQEMITFNFYDYKRKHFEASDILEKEKISHISDKDLEIFIESLHGDMRRGLTELQAAIYSKSSILNQVNKNHEPYTEILQMIDENNYENSLGKVHDLLYEAVDMKTICINLHDVIIKTDMPATKKFKLLRVVGEAEWRSSSMTPKLLASWMIGQMI